MGCTKSVRQTIVLGCTAQAGASRRIAYPVTFENGSSRSVTDLATSKGGNIENEDSNRRKDPVETLDHMLLVHGSG